MQIIVVYAARGLNGCVCVCVRERARVRVCACVFVVGWGWTDILTLNFLRWTHQHLAYVLDTFQRNCMQKRRIAEVCQAWHAPHGIVDFSEACVHTLTY